LPTKLVIFEEECKFYIINCLNYVIGLAVSETKVVSRKTKIANQQNETNTKKITKKAKHQRLNISRKNKSEKNTYMVFANERITISKNQNVKVRAISNLS